MPDERLVEHLNAHNEAGFDGTHPPPTPEEHVVFFDMDVPLAAPPRECCEPMQVLLGAPVVLRGAANGRVPVRAFSESEWYCQINACCFGQHTVHAIHASSAATSPQPLFTHPPALSQVGFCFSLSK